MSRLVRNASVVLKSERLIARRRLAVLRTQTGLMALAGVAAAVGLLAANSAIYFKLAETMSQATAAGWLAAGNFVLAGVLILIAGRINADREVAAAEELRDLAMADLESEVTSLTAQAQGLASAIGAVRRDPLGAALPGLAGAIIAAVLKARKKK
jgi:hypothetical protein